MDLTAVPPEIGQLTNLQRLVLFENELTAVPPEISQLTNLRALSLDRNPLSSPPPEVIAQGTAAIVAYLRSALEQGQREWVSKLLVVGEGGVGKTSLLEALLGNDFNPQQDKTHGLEVRGVDFAHPTARDVAMRRHAWDFGGQEIYHATHQLFPPGLLPVRIASLPIPTGAMGRCLPTVLSGNTSG